MKRKLIRSKIPHLAEQHNNRKNMHKKMFKPNDPELIRLFKNKIVEEAHEISQAVSDVELKYEIVDLVQAIDEFVSYMNISEKEMELLIKAKQYTHGKFIEGTYAEGGTGVYILGAKDES